MPTPINASLYEKAKEIADSKYSKPSAYKSGYIVRLYKEMGGIYADDGKPKTLNKQIKKISGTGTSTEVKSPTKTSTKANTRGNITVTGGTDGSTTTVTIRGKGRKVYS